MARPGGITGLTWTRWNVSKTNRSEPWKMNWRKKWNPLFNSVFKIHFIFIYNFILIFIFRFQNIKLSRLFLDPSCVVIYFPFSSSDNHSISFRNSIIDSTNFLLLSYCFEIWLIFKQFSFSFISFGTLKLIN